MHPQITLPFTIGWLEQGAAEARGLLNLTRYELSLEYQVVVIAANEMRALQQLTVPLRAVAGVRFQHGWFRGKLFIQAHTLETFASVPGHQQGAISLRIAGQDRALARRCAQQIERAISERTLLHLEQELEELDPP